MPESGPPRRRRDVLSALALLLVSAVLLSTPTLYNGYHPFVFADTRHYINFAFTWKSFWARPGVYSVFLRAFHWKLTLWPAIRASRARLMAAFDGGRARPLARAVWLLPRVRWWRPTGGPTRGWSGHPVTTRHALDASIESIPQLLEAQARAWPRGQSIGAPGRRFLTFRALAEAVARITEGLNARGFGRGSRIAIVLPGGLDLALTPLGVSATAVAVPLDARLTSDARGVRGRDRGGRPTRSARAVPGRPPHPFRIRQRDADRREAAGVVPALASRGLGRHPHATALRPALARLGS